jgi:hypothetical protein
MVRVQEFFVPQRVRGLIAAGCLIMAALAGTRASLPVLALLLVASGGLVLLRRLEWILFVIPLAALLVPMQISTGTDVYLNVTALLLPAAVALWFLSMLLSGRISFLPSRLNKPLFVFLLAGLFSLLIGIVLWDPAVPRASSFLIVMLAQWAIVAFSAAALWLMGNLVTGEERLKQLTLAFVLAGGLLALIYVTPPLAQATNINRLVTAAFIRAPLWVLFAALAGGQFLFNHELSRFWRLVCLLVLAATLVYCFIRQSEVLSNWVGVMTVLSVLAWLRLPRLRFPVIFFILLLLASGLLLPTIYEFAGGESEWNESGGSRLLLIGRVLSVTWSNNPITGLGPAAYRPYAGMEPLQYFRALWFQPQINSHNNYVDLFAHFGFVGLSLFFWFAYRVARLGLDLRAHFTTGFAAGYLNGMLALGAASLVIMMLADWILPFIYNISFLGFQASILVWLFMGGLIVYERIAREELERG